MDEVIKKIQELYNLEKSVGYISKVRKGYMTSNFIIGNPKKKYFLKQYIDDEKRIEKTHQAKKFFFQKDIPVVMPLENKDKRTYFCLNDKCYALFPFVDGRQFPRLKMNKMALMSAGEILAKIHLATKDKKPKIKLIKRNYVWNKQDSLERLDKIKKLILEKDEKTKFDKEALKLIRIKEGIIKKDKAKWNELRLGKDHIIHGDFHEANIFFDKNGKVKYVFDWECVSYAPRAMEIARALKLMCFNGRFAKKNYLNASIFLESYNEIYPISAEELGEGIKSEYIIRQAYSLWILDEYYLKGNKKISRFLDDQLRFLQYMIKNTEKHIKLIV
jgi:homoserine kinase type II